MGLIDKISTSILGLQGTIPGKYTDNAGTSKLHNAYSINGDPNLIGKPTPSNLDLNNDVPTKYLDNLPL